MDLFGKKAPEGTPTDRVFQLKQQGASNDQIIQSLKSEGYNSSSIYDAISQAEIRGAVGPGAGAIPDAEQDSQFNDQYQEQPMPPAEEPFMPSQQQNFNQQPNDFQRPFQQRAQQFDAGAGIERIEETVESIIDEKWEELMKSVDKIIAWKEAAETKMTKLEQQMNDLKDNFEQLHSGVLAKIGEYDKGIRDVGADIKAMDAVFKKVLPTFTDNINELSRLTKKMKPGK